MLTQCECKFAGFCKRHGVDKNAKLVDLCQRKANYFDAWEEGRGPGQLGQPSPIDDERRRRIRDRVAYFNRLIGWLQFFAQPEDTGVGDVYTRMVSVASEREITTALSELASRHACCGRDARTNLNSKYPFVAKKLHHLD